MTTKQILYQNLELSRGVQLKAPALCPDPSQRETEADLDTPFLPKRASEQGFGRLPWGEKGSSQEDPTCYLDSKAKSHNSCSDRPDAACGKNGLIGDDNEGNKYFKTLYCGRDYCSDEDCRRVTHKRRIARLLPKAVIMAKGMHFIFTIPEEMRAFFGTPEKLNKIRTYINRRLQRDFPEFKAVGRIHLFGDKDPEKFNPHFHILVDDLRRVPCDKLAELKVDYKRGLERITGIDLGDKKINLRVVPRGNWRKIRHTIRYITRATFVKYDEEIATLFKGYNFGVVWGKWRDPTQKEEEKLKKERELNGKMSHSVILLCNNTSPETGKSIKWRQGIYSKRIVKNAEKQYGCGFYNISNVCEEGINLGLSITEEEKEHLQDLNDDYEVESRHSLRLQYLGY